MRRTRRRMGRYSVHEIGRVIQQVEDMGKLDKRTFDLQPQQLTAEVQRVMQAMSQHNNRASE